MQIRPLDANINRYGHVRNVFVNGPVNDHASLSRGATFAFVFLRKTTRRYALRIRTLFRSEEPFRSSIAFLLFLEKKGV